VTVVCAALAAALVVAGQLLAPRVALLPAAVDHDLGLPEERSRPADHDGAAKPPG